MTDTLGTITTITSLLDTSKQLLDYVRNVQHASSDRKKLKQELIFTQAILQELKKTLKDVNPIGSDDISWNASLTALNREDGPLKQLDEAFITIDQILQTKNVSEKGSRIVNNLLFPLRSKSIQQVLDLLQRQKALLLLALENDHIAMSKAIWQTVHTSMKKWEASEEERHRQELLEWLTPINYSATHIDYRSKFQKGTGQWFIDSPEFQAWMQQKQQTLFCTGMPGVGKTILASVAVDHVKESLTSSTDASSSSSSIGLAYIYCNWQRHHEQRRQNLLASTLKQLLAKAEQVPNTINTLYEKNKSDKSRPTAEELVTAIQSVLTLFSKGFLIIDGLDECRFHECSLYVQDMLMIQRESPINILVTSRSIPGIVDLFSETSKLEIFANEADIRLYIEQNITKLHKCVQKNLELQTDIVNGISKAAGGVFLLARLYLETLIHQYVPRGFRTLLAQFQRPPVTEEEKSATLAKTYREQMQRIFSQPSAYCKLAQRTLSWLVCARKPFTDAVLQHALAVEIGDDDFDEDNIPQIEDILAVCLGLVIVDNETGIIKLIHYTTQEYLEQTAAEWFPDAQGYITSVCCTFISLDSFENGIVEDESFPWLRKLHLTKNTMWAFYRYAALNWGFHAKECQYNEEVIRFLQLPKHVDSARIEARCEQGWETNMFPQNTMFALHIAALYGLEFATKALVNNGQLHAFDENHRKALSYAAEQGHDAVVSILLQYMGDDDCVVHEEDANKTALSYAAMSGNFETANILLKSGKFDVNATDEQGRAALTYACKNGHEEIIKLLLKTPEIDVEIRKEVNTMIQGACAIHGPSCPEEYNEPMWEEDYDEPCRYYEFEVAEPDSLRTPLSYASEYGQTQALSLLIASGKVDVNSQDHAGRTPISYAAGAEHCSVVEQLLEVPDIKPDLSATFPYTPLTIAAAWGHEKVVIALLKSGKVNPNFSCDSSRTALFEATSAGHGRVAYRLLQHGADINLRDDNGKTPLLEATERGYQGFVNFFLENGADAGICNNNQEYPLSIAVQTRRLDIASMLLDSWLTTDAIQIRDSFGQTPVSHAAQRESIPMLRLLLESGFVFDSFDNEDMTPLSYAVRSHNPEAVRLLLAYGADVSASDSKRRVITQYIPYMSLQMALIVVKYGLDISLTDKENRTILSNISYGYCKATQPKNRLEQTPFQLIPKTYRPWKPRQYKMSDEYQPCASLLEQFLAQSGIPIDSTDIHGRTPLSWASEAGVVKIVQFLLEHGAQVNLGDNNGRTALSHAATAGGCGSSSNESAIQVMKLLVRYGASVDSIDQELNTALHYAARTENPSISDFLLQHNADIHARNVDKRTPLFQACQHDRVEVAKLLLDQGADIFAEDGNKQIPLDYALGHSRVALLGLVSEEVRAAWKKRHKGETSAFLIWLKHFDIPPCPPGYSK